MPLLVTFPPVLLDLIASAITMQCSSSSPLCSCGSKEVDADVRSRSHPPYLQSCGGNAAALIRKTELVLQSQDGSCS